MSENALGKASSDCTDNDKSSSVECPTCGKDGFQSVQYMKVHHSHAHGESIAGEPVECANCGEGLRVLPSEKEKKTHHYCSTECMGEHRSKIYSGENHPRWIDEKPSFECEICGEMVETIPAKLEKSRFCSKECMGEWLSENRSGENHPMYCRVDVECETCGSEVKKKPSHISESGNSFCSIQCHRDYQSIHQVGENHHNYDGGRALEYGPNWHKKRREAIERDGGECQHCGVHRIELDRDIHVHHIHPRKKFIEDGVIDHESANKLNNLICLCSSCHQKWEGIPLRPDTS